MADSASIGANFDNYQGNAALGGAMGKPVEISISPLQRLGAFVNLRDRYFWNQRQENGLLLSKEIAKSMDKYDLSLLGESDRKKIKEEYLTAIKGLSEMARNTDVTESPKMMTEVQLKMGELFKGFGQKYNMAKQRNVARKLREIEIQKAYAGNPELMKVQMNALDTEIENTDVTHQISPLIPWKPKDVKIQDPVSHTVNSGVFGSSKDVGLESVIFLPGDNEVSADKMSIGFQNLEAPATIIDKNTGLEMPNPDYDPLQQRIQNAAGQTEGTVWDGVTRTINDVIEKYTNTETGSFNESAFLSQAPNEIVEAYKGIKKYNEYLRKHASLALKGVYDYKGTGVDVPKQITADDFTRYIIEPSKGITTKQMAMSAIFNKFDDENTKVKIDRHNNDLDRANKAALLTGRNLENEAKKIAIKIAKESGGRTGGDADSTSTSSISTPAILWGEFVHQVARTGKRLSGNRTGVYVKYRAIDPIYKQALGISGLVGNDEDILKKLKETGGIGINPDGTIEIILDIDENKKTGDYQYKVTPESFKQGLIKKVHGGSSVDSKFQRESEAVFNELFGSNLSGYFQSVYSSGGKKVQSVVGQQETNANGGIMSDKEYEKFIREASQKK